MEGNGVILSRGVTYRGLEGDCIICDILWDKTRIVFDTMTEEYVKVISKEEGAKIKIDISNPELLDKIKSLKRRRKIWIHFQTPLSIGYGSNDMLITNVLTNEEYLAWRKPYDELSKINEANNRKVYLESLRKERNNGK